MNAFSSYLFYGVCAASAFGGGIGLASLLTKNKNLSATRSSTTNFSTESNKEIVQTTPKEDKDVVVESTPKGVEEKIDLSLSSYSSDIKERIRERDTRRKSTSLVAQYLFRVEGKKDECGEWFQGDDRPSESFKEVCNHWKNEEWYKSRNDKKVSLVVRVDKEKAKDSLEKNNIGHEKYSAPKGVNQPSDSWNIKEWYSCTSSYEDNNEKKVIIECSKIIKEVEAKEVKVEEVKEVS